MVVRQDQPARVELDRAAHHFAGIDRAVIDRADAHYLVGDQAVALVEGQEARRVLTTGVSPQPSTVPAPPAPRPCEEPSPRLRASQHALLLTRLTVAASRRRAASDGTPCRCFERAIISAM